MLSAGEHHRFKFAEGSERSERRLILISPELAKANLNLPERRTERTACMSVRQRHQPARRAVFPYWG